MNDTQETPAAVRHSVTSVAAAEAIAPDAGELRARVRDYLAERGALGATDEETQEALSMNGNTQRARRIELLHAGVVADSTRTRQTRANRRAVVWVLAEFAPKPEPKPFDPETYNYVI